MKSTERRVYYVYATISIRECGHEYKITKEATLFATDVRDAIQAVDKTWTVLELHDVHLLCDATELSPVKIFSTTEPVEA